MIRRFRFVYALYNFFHKKRLMHNVPIYKKLGLNKKYFSSVSSKDFKHLQSDDSIHLNIPSTSLEDIYINESVTVTKEMLEGYRRDGYMILRNYLSPETVDGVNEDIQRLLDTKQVEFKYRNKIMYAIEKSSILKQVGNHPQLLNFLSVLMNAKVQLFYSINFIMGSEQKTHSDSIHMTTFPLGGLQGVWIALEDIDEDNGPLHYYPGSHLLPYYLNADYDNEGNTLMIGDKDYTEYEKMIETKIQELGLKKQIFTAKKGDLLIWHANLFHGGEPHTNKNKTRKSVVFHYFQPDCVCYHEISQRPALME